MILNEESGIETIKSYDRRHWQPLLNLIPVLESIKQAGRIADYEMYDIGDSPSTGNIVQVFLELAYELGVIIDFDWPSWGDFWKRANEEGFDFDLIDIPTKCKLITIIVRADRFIDGVLVEAFESGLILKILQSINRQLID